MKKKPENERVIRKMMALYDYEWLEIDAQVRKKKLKSRSWWIREKLSPVTFKKD